MTLTNGGNITLMVVAIDSFMEIILYESLLLNPVTDWRVATLDLKLHFSYCSMRICIELQSN